MIDYIHAGSKLILTGQMCNEGFDHRPCTLLKEALGIKQTYEGKLLFGGRHVSLPTRRGLILLFDWQLDEAVKVHYITTEIAELRREGSAITFELAQEEFFAEFSLADYHAGPSARQLKPGQPERIRLHGKKGVIILHKED